MEPKENLLRMIFREKGKLGMDKQLSYSLENVKFKNVHKN